MLSELKCQVNRIPQIESTNSDFTMFRMALPTMKAGFQLSYTIGRLEPQSGQSCISSSAYS